MSQKFAKLLSNSKLASLATPAKKFSAADTKHLPTHQTIQTTAASLSRHDFGLKAALPSKVKSRYIIVDDLDTIEHLTNFETVSGFYWTKLRFQELGVPVIPLNHNEPKNVLFAEHGTNKRILDFIEGNATESLAGESSEKTNIFKTLQGGKILRLTNLLGIDSTTPKATLQALNNNLKSIRKDFQKWLLENYPEKVSAKSFNKNALSLELLEFLSTQIKDGKLLKSDTLNEDKTFLKLASSGGSSGSGAAMSSNGNSRLNSKILGNGGLSYLQNGRLHNTVNGFHNSTVVPGRLVSENDTYGALGFVSKLPSNMASQGTAARSAPGKHFKDTMIPSAVYGAQLKNSGAVSLKFKGFAKNSPNLASDSFFLKSKFGLGRTGAGGVGNKRSGNGVRNSSLADNRDANELLNLLKD